MKKKIAAAIDYVKQERLFCLPVRKGLTIKEQDDEIKNDAANIYADSYEEYMEIWKALENI